jgi:hypothetical protein
MHGFPAEFNFPVSGKRAISQDRINVLDDRFVSYGGTLAFDTSKGDIGGDVSIRNVNAYENCVAWGRRWLSE